MPGEPEMETCENLQFVYLMSESATVYETNQALLYPLNRPDYIWMFISQ